jgi:hypothetical protein
MIAIDIVIIKNTFGIHNNQKEILDSRCMGTFPTLRKNQ